MDELINSLQKDVFGHENILGLLKQPDMNPELVG
jgi:hypothetical protein